MSKKKSNKTKSEAKNLPSKEKMDALLQKVNTEETDVKPEASVERQAEAKAEAVAGEPAEVEAEAEEANAEGAEAEDTEAEDTKMSDNSAEGGPKHRYKDTEEERPEPLKGGKKFFNIIDKLGDLFFLNLRFTLCCIPIVTIGAAFTALYSVTNKMVDDMEGKVGTEYWKAFKSNFKEATLAWLINLLYMFFLYVQYRYVVTSDSQAARILFVVLGFEVILLCFELPLLFPMIARYKNTVPKQIINSLVFSVANFGTWFRMFFLWAIPLMLYYLRPNLFVYTWYLWILILTALLAYVCSMFLKKFYAKLEENHLSEEN